MFLILSINWAILIKSESLEIEDWALTLVLKCPQVILRCSSSALCDTCMAVMFGSDAVDGKLPTDTAKG